MNRKQYRMIILFIILITAVVCFIFGNSLKTGDQSNSQSDKIIEFIKPIVDPQDEISYKTMDFVVRKSAHVFEFMILGLCLGIFSLNIPPIYQERMRFFTPFMALFIAIIDEFIQSFTSRTSQVQDVLIDFLGALLGLFLIKLVKRIKTMKN